ncbi:MAG: radical SAM family heme chaperone HemW [Alistipes sp.]
MAGIYLHIPFCKRICAYCDFFHSADLRQMTPLAEALHRELAARCGDLHDRQIRTLYFGGGTPSLYAPAVLQTFIDQTRTLFDCTAIEEITVECNPDDLTEEYLAQLRQTEVNRLSIGIQSFDDGALRLMNRRHSATEAIEAVRRAQRAGFANITIDLIFGISGFGNDILRHTLTTALSLNVQHISAYHLTIEPQTALGRRVARGEFAPVTEEVSEQEFATVHEMLTAAGYEHYEVSNYARAGFRARHNSAYWSGAEYLGIGPGAHSFNGSERRWCSSSVEEYLTTPNYGSETLTERDHRNEWVMTALRTADGIDLAAFAARFGTTAAERLLHEAQPSIAAHTLRQAQGRLQIPPERFLLSDNVIGTLFEL